MFNPRSHMAILAGVSVVALTVLADYLGLLTGVPHPLSALRITGFILIAIGISYSLFRK